MFYTLILTLHNLFRWVVVITAAWALWRAYRGWLGRRMWAVADRRAGLFLTMALDIQFLLGLILAFVSPLSRAAFADLGAAMSAGDLRFLVAEHIPLMVIAVVLAHLGSMASRKASDDPARHRRAALWYSLTTLALLIAIPTAATKANMPSLWLFIQVTPNNIYDLRFTIYDSASLNTG